MPSGFSPDMPQAKNMRANANLAPLHHMSPNPVGQGLSGNSGGSVNGMGNGQNGLENILASVDSRLGLSTGGGHKVADMPSFDQLQG